MSSLDPISVPSVAGTVRPRHAQPLDDRYRQARRWAAGVLGLGTVALAGYLVLVTAALWLVASAIEVVRPGTGSGLDLLAVARTGLPSLLVGWCTGLAALAALVRGDALGPRATGVAAGVVGVLAGAMLLTVG